MRAGDLAVRASFEVSFTSLPPSTDKQGIDPARAFCLLGLWQGPSISSAAAAALFGVPEYSAAGRPGGPGRHPPAGIGGHGPVPVPRPAPGLRRRTGRRRPVRGRAGRRAHPPAHLVHAHRRRRRHRRRAAPLQHPAGRPTGDDVPPLGFATAEEALAWYDSERANLVAATRQAAASGWHEIAWRLPAPLFSIFNSRGNWADCIATSRIALESARQAGNRQGEAWILNTSATPSGRPASPKGSTAWNGRWRSGARSATGWARRRRRTTSPTPISGWDARMRPLTCTGVRWS